MVAHCRFAHSRVSALRRCLNNSCVCVCVCVCECIAPRLFVNTPSTAMASVSGTTAFVVNRPLLREGMQLHEALSMDDFLVNTSSNTQAFFDAVKRRDLHDLPYYLPTAQTATERLTEDTRVRLNNQIYIIDVDLPSELALPFVIHWKADRGVPLRALVVTDIIANLPVPTTVGSCCRNMCSRSRAKQASPSAMRC